MKNLVITTGGMMVSMLLLVSCAPTAKSSRSQTAPSGLHFATGPADGATLALESAQSVLSAKAPIKKADGTASTVRVSPPVATFEINLDDVAAGKGLINAKATGAHSYLVSAPGAESMDVSVISNPTGKSQATGVGMGYGSYALEIAHTKLAGLKEVAAGSYEVRLVNQPPGLPTFLWLKSISDENDLIYPVLWIHADMFKEKFQEKLYPVADFLKIYRPMVKDSSTSMMSGP